MARRYRTRSEPEELDEDSGERDQDRKRPRRRRHDFSHLRGEGGGIPRPLIFIGLGLLALFGAGFVIYSARNGGGAASIFAPMNRDLPLQGPEFDAMAQRFGEGAFKRMILRLGFEPEDMGSVREYGRKAGIRLARYYVRSWNYGRTKGATPELIERLTLGDPEGRTRSIETMDADFTDDGIKMYVDHAIERAEFYGKYGR